MQGSNIKLKCMLLNARSLNNKIPLLHLFLCINKPDIVFITETWLNSKIADSEIIADLPYNITRVDRKQRRGGGVCCLVRKDLFYTSGPPTALLASDCLCLDLFSADMMVKTRIVLVYRPPNLSVLEDEELINALYILCSDNIPVLVLGDFNIEVDWVHICPKSAAAAKFCDVFNNLLLTQLVKSATRGTSVLDLILSSASFVDQVKLLPPLGCSDHSVVQFYLEHKCSNTLSLPEPDYNRVDYAKLNQYLHDIDWYQIFDNYTSTSDLYYRMCVVLYEILSYLVPFRSVRYEIMHYPQHIQNLIAQKHRLFNEIDHPLQDSRYQLLCRKICRHIKKFTLYKERRLLGLSKTAFLRYLKAKIKGLNTPTVLYDSLGNYLLNSKDKAKALGLHFAAVFNCSDSTPCHTPISINPVSSKFPNISIHPGEVLHVMKSLKPSLSATYEGIPQIVFRKCSHTLCYPLSIIFNASLHFGEVPEIWKEALVTAIPKVSNASLVSQYRPISICPTPIKIMEKVIQEKILGWLLNQGIIPNDQHGFLPGASTTTLIVDVINDWFTALDEKKSIDVIFFDLSKAFDKVSHVKLLYKLNHFGIRGQLLLWIEDYLKNRYMTVKYGNEYSDRYKCTSGVPQGGGLSPLLFLAYTADLPSFLRSRAGVEVRLFADDIQIYVAYPNNSSDSAYQKISLAIESMMCWAEQWDIPLNIEKTVHLHLGNTQIKHFMIDDIVLKTVDSFKYLGILLDRTLKFHLHIDYISKKAMSVMFSILRNVQCNDSTLLVNLYKMYVLPHLEYASSVWNPHIKKYILLLEKVQRIFTRIVFYRAFPSTSYPQTLPPYRQRLAILGMKSLKYRRVVHDLLLGFKVFRKEVKLTASKFWVFRPCSRRRRSIAISHHRSGRIISEREFNSFFRRSARWLNALPIDMFLNMNSNAFRTRLRSINVLDILGLDDID